MENIIEIITQTLIIPAVLVLCGYILTIVKSYGERITRSVLEKNEIDSLCALNNVRSSIMSQLDLVSEAVVTHLMPEADLMKFANKGKLTDDQASTLKIKACGQIHDCLPDSIRQDDGNLNKIIGGKKCYYSLVSELIEKHVIEYKNKRR